jgi:ATP-dependent DNA ligase
LAFSSVFAAFQKIAKMSGNSSVQEKENLIFKMLQDGECDEAKYIVRWL